MTQHATARPDAPAGLDAAVARGGALTGSARLRRGVVAGTGATLVLAVASVAAAGAASADQQYLVRGGDTVSQIAARTGASVGAINRANKLAQAATIRIGQQLTIPSGAPTAVGATPVVTAPVAASHTVTSGETVSRIAARSGASVAAIVAANGLDARAYIRVGQRLTIPGSAGAVAVATRVVSAGPVAASHRVASGETVSGIAAKYGTSVAVIAAANGLDARAFIRVGQQLSLTGSAPAAVAATRSVTAAFAAPVAAAAAVARLHPVTAGETLSAIAARYGTSVAAVAATNGLDRRALIKIGQQLTIPGVAAAPTIQLVSNTFAGRTYSAAVVASANANKASLLSTGVPTRAQMQAKIVATARARGVDPSLAQAIAFQESGFNQSAVSPANAIGVMQVIPSSAAWVSLVVGRPLNLLDPNDNVTAGVVLLGELQRTSADLPSAIAGYYQGAASVKRNGMFADTRVYVASVQTLMTRFR